MLRATCVPRSKVASAKLAEICGNRLKDLKAAGTFKVERELQGPQGSHISALMPGATKAVDCLNFCANNYLGMASDPDVCNAAIDTLKQGIQGCSSVRFICGTTKIHKNFEHLVSSFLKTEDTIMYPSCFDANAGVFEAILNDQDAIFSDALNHASIIDGIRPLKKTKRYRYKHMDMEDLEAQLATAESKAARVRMIVTDGVFSMDGDLAPLPQIVDLADKYEACVLIDDAHATGVMGPAGRGSSHHFGVNDRITLINSTMGKALGGASGGFSSGVKELVAMQRQVARPYLFSNAVAPPVVAGAATVIEKLIASEKNSDSNKDDPFKRLQNNTRMFRTEMAKAGFKVTGDPGCPICPVSIGDAKIATEVAHKMFQEHSIYVIAFSFPVVPKDQARIRVQLSAAHSEADVQKCIDAFIACMPKL